MTTILNTIVNQQIRSSAFGAVSNDLGLVVVVLLIVLLIERVLLNAYAGERFDERLQAFNILVLPLLIAFAVIVFMRFVQILQTT